ncbi:hypothetical protein XOCgx_3368 [Xanthomonas oryzae pv. oryzicola]|nr:hypothetical protein XOCgx_3368 [Xanthomonas oryzae pv. oryzicola]
MVAALRASRAAPAFVWHAAATRRVLR